jgi:hypothetical protein
MEKITFAEGPVNGGGMRAMTRLLIPSLYPGICLATEEKHGPSRHGFHKAVDRVCCVDPAIFFTGNLDWHADCQLLSANDSGDFG